MEIVPQAAFAALDYLVYTGTFIMRFFQFDGRLQDMYM